MDRWIDVLVGGLMTGWMDGGWAGGGTDGYLKME